MGNELRILGTLALSKTKWGLVQRDPTGPQARPHLFHLDSDINLCTDVSKPFLRVSQQRSPCHSLPGNSSMAPSCSGTSPSHSV